jgi:DNA-binding NarL/FixJ family response regulator
MNYSIVLVDDHVLIAKALTTIIDAFPHFEVLYEVENGRALQEKFKLAKNIPDIVLLDISMPVMNGFETAQWLKDNHPEVLILTLSMQDDDESLIKMIKHGAKGYLLKNVHPTELEHALTQLVHRGFYYPDWVTSKVFLNLSQDENQKKLTTIKFTDREIEFLKHCCTEMSYKEMAELMFCSPRTVEGYRDSLFDKLSIKSRVGLVLFAIKNGLVQL